MRRSALAVVPLCLLLASCASIMKGGREELRVETGEQKATVTVFDENNAVMYSGEAPATIPLNTGDGYFGSKDYTVKITPEGQREQVVAVPTSLSWWYLLGNVFNAGLGYFLVDPTTGAMWTLERNLITTAPGPSAEG